MMCIRLIKTILSATNNNTLICPLLRRTSADSRSSAIYLLLYEDYLYVGHGLGNSCDEALTAARVFDGIDVSDFDSLQHTRRRETRTFENEHLRRTHG